MYVAVVSHEAIESTERAGGALQLASYICVVDYPTGLGCVRKVLMMWHACCKIIALPQYMRIAI